MRVHLDVLAWLHVLWGVFGLLTGLSLGVLALATIAAFFEMGGGSGLTPAVWVLLMSGGVLIVGGGAMVISGRALLARSPRGRTALLTLVVPNIFVLPFGTALAIYACWVLLNDDARREFGRPARSLQTS
jgi:hypothetical protein